MFLLTFILTELRENKLIPVNVYNLYFHLPVFLSEAYSETLPQHIVRNFHKTK